MTPTHSTEMVRVQVTALPSDKELKALLPTNQSHQPKVVSWFQTCLQSVQAWVRQEIVDDDPWDVETLFPDDPWDAETLYPASSAPSFESPDLDLQKLPSQPVLQSSRR